MIGMGVGNWCTFPTINALKEHPETRGRRGVVGIRKLNVGYWLAVSTHFDSNSDELDELAIPAGLCLIRQSYVMITCTDNARSGKYTDAGSEGRH